jgi:hypothetical protein
MSEDYFRENQTITPRAFRKFSPEFAFETLGMGTVGLLPTLKEFTSHWIFQSQIVATPSE